MTNLTQIKATFPIGTKVESVHNRIVTFEGTVIGYEEDDANPRAICENLTGDKRTYSHNQLARYSI